ncbi:MAG: esterase-like activity of phytase family protein [Sphingomonas sp.]|nr:esterase-like activity of phytase family protein [Sphingomonas sp.]
MKAERRMQLKFSIVTFATGVAILALVLIAHHFFRSLPNREELGGRLAPLRLDRVALDADEFAPLRLVGAWRMSSDDPRVGGMSALAFDKEELVALTDLGIVVRFAKPGASVVQAQIRELPGGPGDARFKRYRDSEALQRDPAGRGWWVAFENEDELWLYDAMFTRPVRRLRIPSRGLEFNTGIEGLTASGPDLLALPELGGRVLRLSGNGWSEIGLPSAKRVSEAAALCANSILFVERSLGVLGFRNSLVRLDRCASGYCVAWRKRLPVGRFDNVEGLAIERLPGKTRLWMITDDGRGGPFRTLLVAADLPPQRR